MPSRKSKTLMTGVQRFAKYAAKMTEVNQEQWSSKMEEKRANYLARLSEQQKDARGTKTQNFPGSNFLRAKTFRTKCAKPFLTTSLKSALLPLTTLPKNA